MPKFMPPINKIQNPPLKTPIATVFDNTGKYLGWMLPDAVELYVYGGLYFHTKRAYSSKSIKRSRKDKDWDNEVSKFLQIIEKRSHKPALVFAMRVIGDRGNLDMNSKLEKAQYALDHEVTDFPITFENIDKSSLLVTFSDEFGFCKGLGKQFQSMMRATLLAFNQERISVITKVRDAEQLLAQASKDTGMKIDI